MKKHKVLVTTLLTLLLLFTVVMLLMSLGIYGKTETLTTQISTLLFSSIAPFIIIFTLINIAIGSVCLIKSKVKSVRSIAIVVIICAFSANGFAAKGMYDIVEVIKKNGGSYDFFKSLNTALIFSGNPSEKIVYRQINNENLSVSVYRSDEQGMNLPVYVYIHGGGWTGNDADTMAAMHEYYAKQGFVVFSINYRLGTKENPTWDMALEDCAYGMTWVYENAESYGGNKDNIVLAGESAGGNLALIYSNASANGTIKELYGLNAPIPSATCVLYPVVDVVAYATEGRYLTQDAITGLDTPYFGGTVEEYPDRVEFASPENYISKNSPPTLIIHGEKDSLVTVNGSKSYKEKSDLIGADTTLITLPYCNHSTELLIDNISSQADQSLIMNYLKEQGLICT